MIATSPFGTQDDNCRHCVTYYAEKRCHHNVKKEHGAGYEPVPCVYEQLPRPLRHRDEVKWLAKNAVYVRNTRQNAR